MHRGRYIDPADGRALVGAYAGLWLVNLTHLKPSTLERYKGIVNGHIVPDWGSWQLGRITPSDVNSWIAKLVSTGLRPSSVRQTHRVLSLILDTAVQDGCIGRNPAKGIRTPRLTRTEPMFLTADQVSELAMAAGGTGWPS
jgi:site-specific recombinase XerC